MKKIICAIMTAMIMCLSVPMTAFAESYPVGDINSNGVTDSNDLREMIVAYAKIMISTNKGGTYEEWNKIAKIDKETFTRLDISGDGNVNMKDIGYFAEAYICKKTNYLGEISYANREEIEEYAERMVKLYTGQEFSFKTMMNYIDSGMPIPNDKVIKGDVNGDGTVDSIDAIKVLQYYANNLVGITQPVIDENAADINEDGVIDSKDSVGILVEYANSMVK